MSESGPWGNSHYADRSFTGGFGNFANQPPNYGGYGGGYGNGDYNAWGPQQPQPRKQQQQQQQHYDDYYYGDERGIKMIEKGMGGLSFGDQDMGGGSKKTTWATIASQPAKMTSIGKKSKAGMPFPPVMPGSWESKNGVAKSALAAPVQAPSWERPKIPPQIQQLPPQMPPSQPIMLHGSQNIPPPPRGSGYQQHQLPPPMNYMPQHNSSPPMRNSHSPVAHSQQAHSNGNGNHGRSASPPPPPGANYPDEMKLKDYNPATFDLMAEGARFFVIKSYSEDDIHRSINTDHGNKRLDEAFKEREAAQGLIYLFFSVNGSGHFCGMAQMMSSLDYHAKASVWSQDKWRGQFKVKWIYVKDVPNGQLRHIKLENNENKPVTNSRDTQEVPIEKGKQVLKIIHSYNHTTSIFDDFTHYEKRQEEEDQRKTESQPSPPIPPQMHNNIRGVVRGGFHDRGGYRGGAHNHGPPNAFQDVRGDHQQRDFRPDGRADHRGGGRGGAYVHPRNDTRDRMDFRERPNREQYVRDDQDRVDRGEPRERDFRGGHRGRPPMRNDKTPYYLS